MVSHPNFFENVSEARMRLRDTVVLYDGHPHYVLNVSDHFKDGAIRIYVVRLDPDSLPRYFTHGVPVTFGWGDGDNGSYAREVDKWLETTKDACGVIRKRMDSPKFGKFRPFEIGNVNFNGEVYYCQRSPKRHTHQGLSSASMVNRRLTLSGDKGGLSGYGPSFYDPDTTRTIIGDFPSAQECLDNLLVKECMNTGAAFHREFAFLKGPIGIVFLTYKSDIIGVLPDPNLTRVRLDPKFAYAKEPLEELQIFSDVVV